MLWKLLNQRHPEYDEVLWREIDVLYEGGYRAMRAAGDYLQALDGEKPRRYADRLRLVSYVGYMGEIVDFFLASLFQADIAVTEAVDADDESTAGEALPAQKEDYWQEFADNADLQKTPFGVLLKHTVRDALLHKRALVACDFPDVSIEPSSRAEEKQMGADRGYAYCVPIDQLIDWEMDEYGQFKWCILYETKVERADPTAVRGMVKHTWTVWTLTPDSEEASAAQTVLAFAQGGPDRGVKARWQRFEKIVPPDFNDWNDELDIPLVDEDVTSFNRIPLLQLELPHGLWAGNFLGPMAREHWARRSYLVGAEARNMIAVGYLEMASSGDPANAMLALEDDDKKKLRDKGMDLALPGRLAFAEPSGQAYAVVDAQLDKLKDEMFRVAHQMAMSTDNSSSSMKRSGTSKQQDKKDVAVVLGALAEHAKDFAVEIYECIAAGRGDAEVVWTARGLDRFVDDDRSEVLQEAVQIDLIGIPSPTWQKEYKTQVALKLAPNLPPETQDLIRKEIGDGVENQQELDDMLLDQQKTEASFDPVSPQDELKAKTDAMKATAGPTPPPGKSNGKPPQAPSAKA